MNHLARHRRTGNIEIFRHFVTVEAEMYDVGTLREIFVVEKFGDLAAHAFDFEILCVVIDNVDPVGKAAQSVFQQLLMMRCFVSDL